MQSRIWGIRLLIGALTVMGAIGVQASISNSNPGWDQPLINRPCGPESQDECAAPDRFIAAQELPIEIWEDPLIHDFCGPDQERRECLIDLKIAMDQDACVEAGFKLRSCQSLGERLSRELELAMVNQWNCEQMGYSDRTCSIFRQLSLQL